MASCGGCGCGGKNKSKCKSTDAGRGAEAPRRASLQTLPRQIVDRILARCYQSQLMAFHPKFYKTYRSFREYAQVCSNMRAAALPYLRRRLIFERYNLAVEDLDRASLTHDELRAAKKLPPDIRWLSNMRTVVEERGFDAVAEVVISTCDRYPGPEDVLAMLKQFGVDQHRWPNVRVLCVNNKSDYEVDDKEGEDGAADWIPEEAFTALARFLLDAFPSVDSLWMDDNRCRRVGPRNALSSYIADHLAKLTRMHLRFSYMPAFGVKVLPAHITNLTLSVHSAYDYVDIPRIVAPTLVTLTLSAIPLNYLWDRFCNSASNSGGGGVVEFTRLERLDLTFHVPYRSIPSGKADDSAASSVWDKFQDREAAAGSMSAAAAAAAAAAALAPPAAAPADDGSGAQKDRSRLKTVSIKERSPKYSVLRTDGRRPRFPRLRHLLLNLYPGRVRDFLRDIPVAQLQTLRISGDLVAFKGLRLRGLTALHSCTLTYFSGYRRREWPHGSRFMAKVLAQGPHLRNLSVTTCSEHPMALPPSDHVLCTGLRRLSITAQVSYADLPPLLRRLPHLEFLDLQRALLAKPPPQARTPDGLAQLLLATDMQPISTSLIEFVPDVLGRDATEETVFYNIFMLIARIPSLRVLKIYSFYSAQFFRELLPLFKIHQLFPHIRHLATLECSD
ncbi:hypothetical protein H4R18_003698 [Coemansia javaensis]|uniref:Uncharacterized protein n=1 Tax=Coemansia javaensis TaxID=2761396 RepID=A0A9W8H7X2_9FUNG|nr:hypothetical protein H4R18_003698 [Coemansia javaensis]